MRGTLRTRPALARPDDAIPGDSTGYSAERYGEELLVTDTTRRIFAALRSIFFAGAFIALWGTLAVFAREYDVVLGGAWLPPAVQPLGWALAAGGALLAASCVAVFASRGRGTPAPFDPPRLFVATGPYRWVRNPMYLGAFGVMFGSALVSRSPGVLLLSAVFALFATAFTVFYEEPALRRRFGDSYAEYRGSVRRWIPRRPS